jgi:small-conductance mechanosensitive channel
MKMWINKIKLPEYLILIVLLIASFTLRAQDDDLDAIQNELSNIESSYKDISKQYDNKKLPTDSLKSKNRLLVVYRDSLFGISSVLNKKLDNANMSLSVLGPAPGAGDPSEPENVTTQRKDLNSKISKITGLVNSTNVIAKNIDKLLNEISDDRSSIFLSGITDRSISPSSPVLWKDAKKELKDVSNDLNEYFSGQWNSFLKNDKKDINTLLLLVFILLSIAVLISPRTKFGKRINSTFKLSSSIPALEKKMQIIRSPIFNSLLFYTSGYILVWGISESGILDSIGTAFVSRFLIYTSVFVFIWYLAKNTFVKNQFIWGKVVCAPGKENQNRYLFIGMILVFLLDRITDFGFKDLGAGMKLLLAQTVISTAVFSIMLFAFFSFKRWVYIGDKATNDINGSATSKDSGAITDKSKHSKKALSNELVFYTGRFIALALLAAILLEYLRLANFLFHRLVLIALFFIFFRTIKTLVQYAITQLTVIKSLDNSSDIKSNESSTSSNTQSEKDMVFYWLNLGVNFVLAILAIPLFLYVIGIDWLDIDSFINVLSNGFKIGAITISFKNIFSGILVFLAISFSVRWATSMINKQLIKHSNMDIGLRNSLITILNYIGVLIAMIAAFPIFGFSFSNITIIAGALSVGIGFGLQDIVVDYFSGLILLIERPIKIGDWVVISAGQGYVKEIRGRVTVIQTFNRAMIIVPNSELINAPVKNWFYKSNEGRVVVTVGVDYSSNTEQVKELLLKCAHDHPAILSSPNPSVFLIGYGENSINFELIGFVKNVDNGFSIKSELRYAIIDQFSNAGIVIPIPQRDIQFKNSFEEFTDNKTEIENKNLEVDSLKTKPVSNQVTPVKAAVSKKTDDKTTTEVKPQVKPVKKQSVKKPVKKPVQKKETKDPNPTDTIKK